MLQSIRICNNEKNALTIWKKENNVFYGKPCALIWIPTGNTTDFVIDYFFNPIPHGLIPRVVNMSDFCAYLAWLHFFPRVPRNFLMVSKQLHLRALSKCCEVSSCLASLCFKSRDKCLWAELVTSSNGVE